MSSALPVFYGMPSYGASSSEKPSLDNSAASDPGGAGGQPPTSDGRRPFMCSPALAQAPDELDVRGAPSL